MIEFFYEYEFELQNINYYSDWMNRVIVSEGGRAGIINYIFCGDDYLLDMNKRHLDRDYYTDIITFDYTENDGLSGDIYVSIERVRENARTYRTTFDEELLRVMAHGLLHLLGFDDGSGKEILEMSRKEDEKIKMFHVEQ